MQNEIKKNVTDKIVYEFVKGSRVYLEKSSH